MDSCQFPEEDYSFAGEYESMGNRRLKLICFVSAFTLGLSLAAAAGGLLHLAVPACRAADNIFGLLFLLALALLNLLVYLNDRAVERSDCLGRFLHRLGYICLAAMIGGLAALAALNLLAAALYSNRCTPFICAGTCFFYFGILLAGSVMAWATLAAAKRGYPLRRSRSLDRSKSRSGPKRTAAAICRLLLGAGSVSTYFLLAGDKSIFFEKAPQLVETLLSAYSLFYAFILLSAALFMLKLQYRPGSAAALFTGLLGLFCFAVYLLPLAAMPRTCREAESEFTRAFGAARPEVINPAWEGHFLETPFSLPAYFLGIFPGEYRYEKDVVYYRGSGGVDEGLELSCDVFMPPQGGGDLPGRGAALIRIHGGAWISGDKGFSNMMQVNKYFASRGYTVFDVQYGLTNLVKLAPLQPYLGPPGLTGPFTLDDMVRHLGIFTNYLARHADAYNLDLDSVFISGGSAGGQLATATALAAAGGFYPHLFSDKVRIKGFIPLYPANRVSFLPALGRAAEWIDVELLVDEKSPPCLICQGTKDGVVSRETAMRFREAYRAAGNGGCAVLELQRAGHAADFYFPGYYNQLWIFYMERFMALHR